MVGDMTCVTGHPMGVGARRSARRVAPPVSRRAATVTNSHRASRTARADAAVTWCRARRTAGPGG